LAVTMSDLTVVCKDGVLPWNRSLLAAWSPLLRQLLVDPDTVLVLKDFTTSVVTKCFSLLCYIESPNQLTDDEVLKLCNLLMIGTLINQSPIKVEIECEPRVGDLKNKEPEIQTNYLDEQGDDDDTIISDVYDQSSDNNNSDNDEDFIPENDKKFKMDPEVKQEDDFVVKDKSREQKRRQRKMKVVRPFPKPPSSQRPSAPKVWIKEPSPDRYLNGVKTDVYYMSPESLAAGPPYKCLLCDYKTPVKRYLKLHFQRRHSKEKLFKCIVCGVAKSNTCGVVEHWQRMHNPNKKEEFLKHVCDICGKMYAIPSELKTHKLLHEDLNLTCKYCGKSCKTPTSLDSHEKRHEAERAPCNICGKTLANEREAREHELLVHTNNYSVDCEVCGKTLKCKANLKLHMRNMHSHDEKTHHCHLCNVSFRVPSLLQKHIEIVHEKSRMFPCPYCETVLSCKDKFKRHSQRRHEGRDLPPELKESLRVTKHWLTKVNSTDTTV